MAPSISAIPIRWRRQWLCVLLCLLASADVGLTLSGQPAGYWQGEWHVADEANPLGRWLLHVHPLALGLTVPAEMALAGILLVVWPTQRSSRFVVVLAALHALGAASWLTRSGPLGCVSACLFLAVTLRLAARLWQADLPSD